MVGDDRTTTATAVVYSILRGVSGHCFLKVPVTFPTARFSLPRIINCEWNYSKQAKLEKYSCPSMRQWYVFVTPPRPMAPDVSRCNAESIVTNSLTLFLFCISRFHVMSINSHEDSQSTNQPHLSVVERNFSRR